MADADKFDAPETDAYGNVLVEDDGSEDRQLDPELATVIELFPGRLSPLKQKGANRFEKAQRAAKVAAMMSLVPFRLAKSQAQVYRLADRLALFTPAERLRWANRAGCAEPSPTTWQALVDQVRAYEVRS